MTVLDYGTGLTLQNFISNGDEFLIGEIASWGKQVGGTTVATFSPLDQSQSISSLAIGPDSDHDRVQINYGTPVFGSIGGGRYNQQYKSQTISVDYPWLMSLRDGKRPSVSPNTLYILELTASEEWYYFDPEGVVGTVQIDALNNLGTFLDPKLQLILTAGNQKLPATSGARNPKFVSLDTSGAYWDGIGNGIEAPYLVMPIHGRKKISISARGDTAAFTMRVAVITGRIEHQIAPGGYPSTTPIPSNSSVRFDLSLAERCEFMIIYASRTAGSGVHAQLRLEIVARDK